MTKVQANYYLRRCYRVLRDTDAVRRVRLRLMARDSGSLEPDGTMLLNPLEAILPTALHECLHEIYHDDKREPAGESVILYLEAEISKLLSPRQWTNLYHRVGEAIASR